MSVAAARVPGRSVVPLDLKPLQYEVFSDPSRFRVVVAGRRSGKTHLAAVELLYAACSKQEANCWYVAPTHQMAKEIAWRLLKTLVPRGLLAGSPNETYLTIPLVNGSEIGLRSADKPDSLRGRGLDFLVPDEFAWIDESAWSEVLRPALADRGGRALFITTPKGFNWSYDLFLRGVNNEPGWKSWQYTTADAGIVPQEEIEAAKRELDPRIFRQEYEASFETLHGRVYSNFNRDEHVRSDIEDTGAEILVGMDFNVNPMSAVVAVRAADQCHVLESIEVPTSNTEEMAAELKTRYPGRRIVICPDPSGRARKTSAPVGQTDFTILERAGFDVRAPSKAPPIKDRVNNVETMLLAADGTKRLFVKAGPQTAPLIRALDGLTYKEGTSQPDKSLGLDHITDALGYLLWEEFNLMQDNRVYGGIFEVV